MVRVHDKLHGVGRHRRPTPLLAMWMRCAGAQDRPTHLLQDNKTSSPSTTLLTAMRPYDVDAPCDGIAGEGGAAFV